MAAAAVAPVVSALVDFLNASTRPSGGCRRRVRRRQRVPRHRRAYRQPLPVSKVTRGGYLEVGVQTYGGGLWHTWFDRDLTVAGRVIVRKKETDGGVVSTDRDDRAISSEGLKINNQNHLVPVLATCVKNEMQRLSSMGGNNGGPAPQDHMKKHHPLLLQLIAKEADCEPDEICDFELQLCDTQPSVVAGSMKEFVFSGRLDNLCMSFCSLKALTDSTSAQHSLDHESGVRMVALFDHEEEAGSPALLDALSRIIGSSFNNSSNSMLLQKAIQRSFLMSADMAHALHPNYADARWAGGSREDRGSGSDGSSFDRLVAQHQSCGMELNIKGISEADRSPD
ncbi:hypothetical protein U9M48_030063 [Paspalum notatum var. saurae]|uniref:Aspartyl aminopeptidase n=1 Tax=Paspalum notatum var. saurae TaxID=547442 RepID=A0AAQ3X2X3_PASNO